MLNWTERMVRMRKEVPEIGWGRFSVVDAGTPAVLVMRYEWRNNAVLFVHNLSALPREVRLVPGAEGSHDSLLVNLLSEDHSRPEAGDEHCILLEPYGYRWFRVGGLDYLLRRSGGSAKAP